MLCYPAIDIRDGAAVRLLRGDYGAETRYDDDPLDAARRWVNGGAAWLHVVDLDGAKAGMPVNADAIRRIIRGVDVPVQVGGGLRSREDVGATLAGGAARVVLGTAALTDRPLLDSLLDGDAGRIVVGVDARGGRVSVAGWTETSDLDAAEAVAELAARGARRFLFTPIEVDGTMEGPNLGELERVANACRDGGATLIASGGVGELEHLRALRAAMPPEVEGVVVGRALYEGRFTVEEAVEALQ